MRKKDKEAARGLGVASLAIGLTELAAPRQVEHLLGIGDGRTTGVIRALGVRELMHGVDILSHDDPTPGVWARIAGDALDGAALAVAATKTRRPLSFAITTAMVLGIVALDVIFAERLAL